MSRILAISSQVACGHVGLSAIVPAVQGLGHEVIALPTVVLSNHPGFGHVAGVRSAPADLTDMVTALAANGWLGGVDTVLTGYLPSAELVGVAADAIDKVRQASANVTVICDPVLGDDKEGLYIDPAAAAAIAEKLMTAADVILPNRFELGWLAGVEVTSIDGAITAARTLRPAVTLATSIAAGDGLIANVRVDQASVAVCREQVRSGVPKGTGDFLSGVYAADPDLGRSCGRVAALIDASIGQDHLMIAQARERWVGAAARPVQRQ